VLEDKRLLNACIWAAFSGAVVLATAPVWRMWVFGFNPTLDQLLQLSICGGPIR
jgi:hypothetical protein